MKLNIFIPLMVCLALLTSVSIHPSYATTYFVRIDGGDAAQCTGQVDAPYSGSGESQACALNHLFWLLPPHTKKETKREPLLRGGDTVIIGQGEYLMGYGAPNTSGQTSVCSPSWTYDCVAAVIPGGPDAAHPTRILGKGWDTKATSPPQLYGSGRAGQILKLKNSDNVEIRYLELTDHSPCIYNSPDPAKRCNRKTFPMGDQADYAIKATDSRNVVLSDLNIHGLSLGGIQAGRLTDWTVEGVTIRGNGFVGWNGDVGAGKSSNSGQMIFKNTKIEFNGCGEKYPSNEIYGCFSQSQGGYGDGLGTHSTGGDWLFDGVEISHNTSDGLDLLYHDGSGNIIIKRSRFEGNAGNAVKIAANTQIENSILISNCDYFSNNPQAEQGGDVAYFTQAGFDSCRATGTALVSAGWKPNRWLTLTNSLIMGTSSILIEAKGNVCDGSERFVSRNNIFVGMEVWFKKHHGEPGVKSELYYLDGSDGNGAGACGPADPATKIKFDNQNSIVHNVRHSPCLKNKYISCVDPKLVMIPPLSGALDIYTYGTKWNLGLRKDSPAIGRKISLPGSSVFQNIVVPFEDMEGKERATDMVIWGPYGSILEK